MPGARDDYLVRLVQQLARAIARAAGLRTAGRPDEAIQELQAARRDLFGPAAGLVSALDAETAARLLGAPDRVLGWAELLAEEAAAERERGDGQAAERLEARALAMLLHAGADSSAPPAWAAELARRTPATLLPADLHDRHAALGAGRWSRE